MNKFAAEMARKYIEMKLPEIIGFVAKNVMQWIEAANSSDVERVASEMPDGYAVKFRRVVAAVKATP